jgi:hypothetical protein
MNLSIANVISISVATPQTGLGQYNTSNLAIFTAETFDSGTFGSAGYKIYLGPTEVASDFGTDSKTYKMALGVFSQQPNILLGGGYLVVIPFTTAVHHFALSGVPASGSFTLAFTQGTTAAIQWNDNAAAIQTKIRAVAGLEQAVVTGALSSQAIDIALKGVYGPETLPTVGGSGLSTSGPVAITITPTTTTAGESFADAITRTVGLVEYFGLIASEMFDESNTTDAAAVVQALNKLVFFVSNDSAAIEVNGIFDLVRLATDTHSRCLYYGSDTLVDALIMGASYAGLGLSTNFSGSNTTQTMHLKSLNGVIPDPSMTQTLLNKALAAGADTYVSIQGVPKVFCSGANDFFDNQYNLGAFAGALQVALFNALATTNTKIPQTEGGMDVLKSAARAVCEQYVSNQFLAPGVWTNPTTFGNQANLLLNVSQRGYYIYSSPISQQSPADRADRKAPLVQIAAKYAGAIHSATVIVYVNP